MPNENEASQYIALALVGCVRCKGLGTSGQGACICVDRSVFRIVLAKFRQCATGGHLVRPLNIDGTSGPRAKVSDGRKNEEYWQMLVGVQAHPNQSNRMGYLPLSSICWGPIGNCAARRLKMDRGNFFMRIPHRGKAGQVFRELQPYALYPWMSTFKAIRAVWLCSRSQSSPRGWRPDPENRRPTDEHVLSLRSVMGRCSCLTTLPTPAA